MFKSKSLQRLMVFIMILALTSISCGVANLPFFATETPTPTATFTPSPTTTPTLAPTSTPTQIPTATPLPTGVVTEEQADGSTLFIDYDNYYQLDLPRDWFVIPLSSGDIADILITMAEENPELSDTAEAFSQLDPNVIRVIAINNDTKYASSGFSTNLTVTAVEDKLLSSMPLDFVTGAVEESLKQQGAALLSDHNLVTTNANGVEIGTFEFEQTSFTATGSNIQIRSKTIIFQSNGKLIMVQLTTPSGFGDELFPLLDEITASVKLIKP